MVFGFFGFEFLAFFVAPDFIFLFADHFGDAPKGSIPFIPDGLCCISNRTLCAFNPTRPVTCS
jgi:hypothetical protein